MTLKPTIIDGEWVYRPAPPQDHAWLSRRQSDAEKTEPQHKKEARNG